MPEHSEQSETAVEEPRTIAEISAPHASGFDLLKPSREALGAAAIRVLGDGVAVIDDEGVIHSVSDFGAAMLGWRGGDLIGKSHAVIAHPVHVEGGEGWCETCAICRVLRTGEARRDVAMEFFSREGSAISTKGASNPIRENGQLAGVAVSFRQVSREPGGEGDKGKERDLYRSFFENAIDGAYQCTPDGQYLKANKALGRLYGYASPDELIEGMKEIGASLYVDPNWRQEFLRLMNENGSVMGFEALVFRRDGSTIWISNTARTIYDSKGAPLYYEGTVYDISHRKRTEDALRKSQRFIEGIADASPAILYVYDLHDARFVYVNNQVFKALGYSVEDVVTMGPQFLPAFLHPDDVEILDERTRVLGEASDGQAFLSEYRIKNMSGEYVQLQCRETVFTRGTDGCPEQVIGMALDISERKRAQGEIEKSREQLRALSARLQEVRENERVSIAREVHDELGQSLTALGIDITWLQTKLPKMQTTEPIDTILEKLATMASLIDPMIRTVQKVATKLRPPILDEFGLVAAIEWQAREFEKRCGVRCEVTMEWRTKVDQQDLSTAVFRIFQEIMTNVARHARASKVQVRMRELPDALLLSVKDSGRGITEGEESKSLGILGMRERALTFGGAVEIVGQPGKGTTATVRIPRAELKRTAPPRRAVPLRPKKESLRNSTQA